MTKENTELVKRVTENMPDKDRLIRAATLMGGIRAVNRVAENLSAQTMAALIEFQKEDLHEIYGFSRFVDFLEESEYSPMSKNEFYKRKDIFEAEGLKLYDAFNEAKIPLSTRKLLLEKNDIPIYVDGDNLIVGETETPISNNSEIKQLVQDLAAEIRHSKDALKIKEKKIETLQTQVETGQEDYNELQRAFDGANQGTPYQQALVKAVGALVQLAVVANQTPIVEKSIRGVDDLQALMAQMSNVRAALCQDDFIFTDNAAAQDISPLARLALEESGDWNDENEQ